MKLRQPILGTLMVSCIYSLSAAATADGFAVNTQNREEVRNFFNTVYQASEDVPIGWGGDVGQCQAGTLSPDYLNAVALRVNFFRALAGVPANVTLNEEYNRKAQQGALMMSANKTIDHHPSSSWLCYTAEGAEAAGKSNLSIGSAGPQAVSGLVADGGDNNTATGHRRWTLYPTTQMMGIGSIPAAGNYPATAVLWVFDTPSWNNPRPTTRNDFVSWPPSGFVPYSLVFPRWSVSYPEADFSQATVTMQTQGVPVPLQLEPLSQGFGDNTLVWVPNITLGTVPATDTSYSVSVNNVMVGSTPRTFSYTVTLFDPAKLGTDSVFPVLSGSDQPVVNRENVYTFNAVPHATGYQWSQASRQPFVQVEGAESGLDNFQVRTSSGYDVITTEVKANGTSSFHLAHPQADDQVLTLKHTLLPTQQGALSFASRLGLSSTEQVAKVQLSTDAGKTWRDIFTQAGTASGNTSSFGEESFTVKTISLVEWAGKAIQVRFSYTVQGTFYPQTTGGVGWYIDDISFANVEELTRPTLTELPTGLSFNFKPTSAGSYALQVRAKVYDKYPLEWGPVKQVETGSGTGGVSPSPSVVLTVTTSGNGKVTSSVPGIDCGTTCSASYPAPTSVSLIATPSADSQFQQWRGDCTGTSPSVSVVMDATKNCGATFGPKTTSGSGSQPTSNSTLPVPDLEPAADEVPIDYYRDDATGDVWGPQPAWQLPSPTGKLPTDLWKYGLRSIYLAKYACQDAGIRDWMPTNIANGVYYCTNPKDRQQTISYLRTLAAQLTAEDQASSTRSKNLLPVPLIGEPGSGQVPIDYYRDSTTGDVWGQQPAWQLPAKGTLPPDLWKYGLRSIYLAKYACQDAGVREWMPTNIANGIYYCTNPKDRQQTINYLRLLADKLEAEMMSGTGTTTTGTTTTDTTTTGTTTTSGSGQPTTTDNGEPAAFAGTVAAHNVWRQQVGVPNLTWSATVAQVAQAWADDLKSRSCAFEHRPNNQYGENIYWASGFTPSPKAVVDSWAGEIQDYNYADNSCTPGKMCGHYTQVVWRDTQQVGCGTATCNDGSILWVCNYNPPGNYVGQKPY